MTRRGFLYTATGVAACAVARAASTAPGFTCDNRKLQQAYEAALGGLAGNIFPVDSFPHPVLFEGATYRGVWLECAPLEGLVYAPVNYEVARANHEVYFDLQKEDGQFPCSVRKDRIGWGQIQMVVPAAGTAFDLYRRKPDAAFLEKAYSAWSRWDAWLLRYRNTRKTGLCEAFCTYDTGHDNSPRFLNKPRQCPNGDARVLPEAEGLPYLAPDLSSTVYGGRMALAAMAREMGRKPEEARWLESAAAIRKLILDRLYDPHDAAFYDLDSKDRFVRIRGDVITRVMGEHVADQKLFEEVWRRQLHNPKAFWTPYPLPSIAADDAAFVRPIPRNSWGGASQALTALRTPRWMEHYGKYSAFTHLMTGWAEALARDGRFLQQMDPQSGEFSPDQGAYSPAMLVLFDFVSRLYGVRAEGDTLEWNCRLPADSTSCMTTAGDAELRTTAAGSTLAVGGKDVAKIAGRVRVVTALDGTPRKLIGTESAAVRVMLESRGTKRSWTVAPDRVVDCGDK